MARTDRDPLSPPSGAPADPACARAVGSTGLGRAMETAHDLHRVIELIFRVSMLLAGWASRVEDPGGVTEAIAMLDEAVNALRQHALRDLEHPTDLAGVLDRLSDTAEDLALVAGTVSGDGRLLLDEAARNMGRAQHAAIEAYLMGLRNGDIDADGAVVGAPVAAPAPGARGAPGAGEGPAARVPSADGS